jgi:Flp pilus assembly pilin Flp
MINIRISMGCIIVAIAIIIMTYIVIIELKKEIETIFTILWKIDL